MTRVLFASFISTHFVELIRVARAAREGGQFSVVIAFPGAYEGRERDEERALNENFQVYNPSSSSRVDAAAPPAPERIGERWRGILNRSLLSLPLWVRREQRATEAAKKVLEEVQPGVLVIAEDNAAYHTGNWIAAARRLGVAIVVVPYTVAGPSEAGEALLRNEEHSTSRWSNKLLAVLLPRWKYVHRGVGLVLLPAPRAFAKEIAGTAPRLPWVLHSGDVDAIAVESRRMMVHYVREGLSKERLYLTGAAADDILAATLSRRAGERQKLEEQLGMPRGRPLLLCAPPPDQFVFYGMQSEFPTYAALLAAWINELEMLEGWNVVVRPHPRELNRPIPTSERTNVVISRADTASLVPLADLYVASISATIRWAIACGIPVVNYDAYRVGYTDYDGVTAVVRVETLSTFSLALGRFSNESYRADMMNSQRLVSSEWGELDGRSMQRTLELLRTTGSSRSAEN